MTRAHGRRWLGVWLVATVVIAGGTFAAGALVRSPLSDASANAAKIPWTTTTVIDRDFTAVPAQAQGTLSLGGTFQVALPDTTADRAVVTAVGVTPGSALVPGTSVVAISGRPLIALNLAIPMYRDLAPGMTGPDVASLQTSLASLGLYSGRVDGDYGMGTSKAVAALYRRVHQDAPAAVGFTDGAPTSATAPRSGTTTAPGPTPDAAASTSAPVEAPDQGIGAGTPADQTPPVGTAVSQPTPAQPPTGIPLLLAEVVDVPHDETIVATVPAVGQVLAAGAPVITARTGQPYATARVSVADKDAFTPGAAVDVQIAGGTALAGKVASLSDFRPGTDGGAPPGYDLRVDLTASDVAGVADQAVVTISPTAAGHVQHSAGLPVAAVRQIDGGAAVILNDAHGTVVPVTTGLVDDGWVQIVAPADLAAGTTVRVGGPEREATK